VSPYSRCSEAQANEFLTSIHFLLFLVSLPILIPYVDRAHATMLFWLRPSRQIRAPVYSFKQRIQRRRIITTYGPLYLLVMGFGACLIVLPVVFRSHINKDDCKICNSI
jgi:1,3-beta-glucan synthase